MREYKGRQKRQFTVGDHADDNCEVHMYNPALARDLAGNIAAASLFWHISYNVKSRLASGEVDKFGVSWYRTSYTGILHFLGEFLSKDQVITLVDLLDDQGLIVRIKSNNKNGYTLTPMGYMYAKDRNTLADKIPTAEAIATSFKHQEAKRQVNAKTNDPRIKEVIDYFNKIAGEGRCRFGMGKTNTGLVEALLNKGYSPEIIKKVVKYKCEEFMGTKYEYRARPSSILGELFEIWLRQLEEDPDGSKADDRKLEYSRERVVYSEEEQEQLIKVLEAVARDCATSGIDAEPDQFPFK